MSPPSLLSVGRKGAAVKYADARQVQRWIWIADNVKEKHTELTKILTDVVATAKKWHLIDGDRAEFEARYNKAAKSHRNYNVLGIQRKQDLKDFQSPG